MNYTINSKTLIEDSIITNITATLEDQSVITIDVSHFRPNSIEEIVTGIENRLLTEQIRIDAILTCAEVFNQIEINGN